MLKKARLLTLPPRRAKTPRPAGKAAGESKPEAYPRRYVEGFDDPRTKLADFFSILLCLLHEEQCQTSPKRGLRQDRAVHSKRGKLTNRYIPADVKSVRCTILTNLCRTDDERIASSPKNSTDRLHAFDEAGW